MEQDETALLRECKAGNAEAFAEIMRRSKARVYRFLYGVMLNEASAEDLTQETFVRFWRSLASFDLSLPLYPWLRRIGFNLALNEMKRKKEKGLTEAVAESLGEERAPERPLMDDELRAKIRAAVESLDADKRAVVTMRLMENMSYAEIARELECSIGTVMSRLFRARAALKEKLGSVAV
ncbi:MAG: hypothetical protein A2Z34_05050 [Planctomycetes bacterium RBG_16_59_8]|nr:MAG: hypothetical protein A2Z34_05050 [Planctomycetes bacterium RBG_16_59_8]